MLKISEANLNQTYDDPGLALLWPAIMLAIHDPNRYPPCGRLCIALASVLQ